MSEIKTPQHTRLISLIEFAQQSAALKGNPPKEIASHGIFHEHENSLQGLPGVLCNAGGEDEELWLVVERLHETSAPNSGNNLLSLWLEVSNNPAKHPSLKPALEISKLIEAGFITIEPETPVEVNQLVILSEFEKAIELETELQKYIDRKWQPWAIEERKRRQTIQLYGKLFMLKQHLEGAIVDTQIEVAWGVGVCVWNMQGAKVSYPLITRLVDISTNELSMAIEVRPRDIEPRLELDIFSAADNPGTSDLEKAYKDFLAKSTQTFSPFDPSTFEGILRSAVASLDSKGVYWPSQTTSDDRKLPPASDELKVTDTWTIFARPRSKNILVQDLERFKKDLDRETETMKLPKAIMAVLTDPVSSNTIIDLPNFRGISLVGNGERSEGQSSKKVDDLYFPMAFNDEQVRIVQMLEKYDGVVVQGPPGTGKTHTIANIISHYFALGKRVLVTSMKEPALAVLRDKLPEEIRPLAISLLSNEQEGMKQFEYAISKIAQEIQLINPTAYKKDIADLESLIDSLHARLAKTDRAISDWAKKNSQYILIDGASITPVDAAKEVVESAGHFEWLDDNIGLQHQPLFDNADIICLREARNAVANDMNYFGKSLPEIVSFPTTLDLITTHQNLSRYADIEESINKGTIPSLRNSSDKTLDEALALLAEVKKYIDLDEQLKASSIKSIWEARSLLKTKAESISSMLEIFDSLGSEIKEAVKERQIYISKPVTIPQGAEFDADYLKAIDNSILGKSPFGIGGLIGKSVSKKYIDDTKILANSPESSNDWQHIKSFIDLNNRFRELLTRWNSVAAELSVDIFDSGEPLHIHKAFDYYATHMKIREHIEIENAIIKQAQEILPTWADSIQIGKNSDAVKTLKSYLENHAQRNRLSKSWAGKESVQRLLSDYSGKIIDDLKIFTSSRLGNPSISDAEIQSEWSALIDELKRIHSLRGSFGNLKDICEKIEKSGAPKWADRLRTTAASVGDGLIPDNWNQAWRLARLSNFLTQADARNEIRKLSDMRKQTETDLAKAYKDVITKRTWLKLWENATPDIRSALESFRSAVAKIGKGTGKRAVRYRQDARNAASRANKAVPCWIMPHWRVSESLPPDFGCFDLVIIDEASQSDLSALPALLRAQKVLIVGDDKQVSPDGVGLEEEKIRNLMTRYLSDQVEHYRAQMTPERSIYDLFKVVFASSSTMLREHFRCIGPIIEYSKREFYNHELRPVRLPLSSERLDPPLIDVLIEDGYRKGDINIPEARFIVDEIKAICDNPKLENRTIGIVSLLADKQALKIWEMLENELGPEKIAQHEIACGDARTFQGKERDIMFLSMIVSEGNAHAQTKDATAQRFNVAASRARDRMYLVRSIELDQLSPSDKLRRNLITHFASPFGQDQQRVENLRSLCESDFERELYDILTERGYRVTPQVKVGAYRIDMVVEGHNDSRLAIECDGDRYHGEDRWDDDMNRQRILERVGWQFWRCFASAFVRDKKGVLEDLLFQLSQKGIEPIGVDALPQSIHTESRRVTAMPVNDNQNLILPEDSESAEQESLFKAV